MKYLAVLNFLTFLLFAACGNPVQKLDYGSGDDYDIYRTALSSDSGSTNYLLVLSDSTRTSLTMFDSTRVQYFKNCMPGMQDESFQNFVAANAHRSPLRHIAGVKNLEIPGDGQELSGRDTVYVTLSKVGYNISRTQALIEVGESVGPLAGSGSLVLLERVNGKWYIKSRCMSWIS